MSQPLASLTIPPASRSARARPPGRNAFTLIELLMVLSIMAILSLISLAAVPAVTSSLRKGAVNNAADRIVRVAEAARELSRRSPAPTGDLALVPHYGIAIVADGAKAYATVTFGTTTTDELMVNGFPQLRMDLGASALVYAALGNAASTPMSGRLGWFYQYGSGRPIEATDKQKAIPIGTRSAAAFAGKLGDSVQLGNYGEGMVEYWGFNPPLPAEPASPVACALELRSPGGRYALAIAFYPVGPSSTVVIP